MEPGRRDYCKTRRHQTRENKSHEENKYYYGINEYYDNVLIKPNNPLFPITQTVGFANVLKRHYFFVFRKIIKKQLKVRVNVDVYSILYPVLLSYYSVSLSCR